MQTRFSGQVIKGTPQRPDFTGIKFLLAALARSGAASGWWEKSADLADRGGKM